jgi:hypothetical protein
MERFFKIIGRINSVLLLLVMVGGSIGVVWYALFLQGLYAQYAGQYDGADYQADSSAATGTAAEQERTIALHLGDADSVTGTTTQMLSLTADFYGSDHGTQIRNILFLSPDGPAEGRWLFPTHGNLILENDQIRPWDNDDSLAASVALYFEFVPDDSDDGFNPTEYDLRSVALSNPDGRGFVEVLHGVDEVLSYEQLEAGVLTILYSDVEAVHRARIALNGFTILSDQPLAKIPDSL